MTAEGNGNGNGNGADIRQIKKATARVDTDVDDYFVRLSWDLAGPRVRCLTNGKQIGPRDLHQHSKWPIFLRLHGSVAPEMVLPLIFVGGWATMIVCISEFVFNRKSRQQSIPVQRILIGLGNSRCE